MVGGVVLEVGNEKREGEGRREKGREPVLQVGLQALYLSQAPEDILFLLVGHWREKVIRKKIEKRTIDQLQKHPNNPDITKTNPFQS